MKRSILFSFSLIALATSVLAEQHTHWSYTGNSSPEHWGELSPDYATCKIGQNQSPVDLVGKPQKRNMRSVNIQPTYFAATVHYQLENNGHTLQASAVGNAPSVTIDGKKYTLKQFHFHTPSEHTFNGQHSPMEIHFVHQAEDGALSVLGVMVNEGKANETLEPLLAKPLDKSVKLTLEKPLDIRLLFPSKRAYFRLTGSLTTPPCSENVAWVVFKNPISASKAQIKAMERIIGHNNRPVQLMNNRSVEESE